MSRGEENLAERLDKILKNLQKINFGSKWITIPFLALIFYYIFAYFKNNIADLQEQEFHFQVSKLLIPGLLIWAAMLLNAFVYHQIIAGLDSRAKLGPNIRIWFYSYLGRFFPGKVGLVASRVVLHKQHNISGRIALFAFYLETLISAITTLFIYLFSTIVFDYPFLQNYRVFSWILMVICLLAVHPRFIRYQLSLLMKLKGETQKLDYNLNFMTLLSIFILRIVIWGLLGLSFYYTIIAFIQIPFHYYPYLTGIFALGNIIGLLAVFAPSGLGVLEGILLLGLKYIVPDGIAVVISIAVRIVKVIAELSIIFIVYGIVKLYHLENSKIVTDTGKK